MPARNNSGRQVALHIADKPPQGMGDEISLRADTANLWNLYRGLDDEKRVQFLQAAAKWQEAMMHWQDRPSLSFSLMVVACEALKPSGADERQNCYDVIGALLGASAVDRIRQSHFPAQSVRSTHLHEGKLHDSELSMANFLASYHDPSFREAHREMARVTPSAIVEWLKRQGVLQLPRSQKRRTILRWIRNNMVVVVVTGVVLGISIGCAIGWLVPHG
jgi:hypothetical protein